MTESSLVGEPLGALTSDMFVILWIFVDVQWLFVTFLLFYVSPLWSPGVVAWRMICARAAKPGDVRKVAGGKKCPGCGSVLGGSQRCSNIWNILGWWSSMSICCYYFINIYMILYMFHICSDELKNGSELPTMQYFHVLPWSQKGATATVPKTRRFWSLGTGLGHSKRSWMILLDLKIIWATALICVYGK